MPDSLEKEEKVEYVPEEEDNDTITLSDDDTLDQKHLLCQIP